MFLHFESHTKRLSLKISTHCHFLSLLNHDFTLSTANTGEGYTRKGLNFTTKLTIASLHLHLISKKYDDDMTKYSFKKFPIFLTVFSFLLGDLPVFFCFFNKQLKYTNVHLHSNQNYVEIWLGFWLGWPVAANCTHLRPDQTSDQLWFYYLICADQNALLTCMHAYQLQTTKPLKKMARQLLMHLTMTTKNLYGFKM